MTAPTTQGAVPPDEDWRLTLVKQWSRAYPRMDIYTRPGQLVMFDGNGGYDSEKKRAIETLTMRGLYTVAEVTRHSTSSTVRLVGVKGEWNTVLFSVAPDLAASPPQPEAAAAPEAGGLPGGNAGWIATSERMPPLGEQVLTWCHSARGPYPMVDCWDEQHESPVSWSSATIPIGPGWDSGNDFEQVSHWQPITTPGAAPVAPLPPAQENGK